MDLRGLLAGLLLGLFIVFLPLICDWADRKKGG